MEGEQTRSQGGLGPGGTMMLTPSSGAHCYTQEAQVHMKQPPIKDWLHVLENMVQTLSVQAAVGKFGK